jgi:hypothetical protein
VSDQDIEFAVKGLLERTQSLGIPSLRHMILRHPNRDPGCYTQAHEMLRAQARNFRHALVLFDRLGCGNEGAPVDRLESEVEQHLSENGWNERAAAVVLDPEIEAWVWSASPEVGRILGWPSETDVSLRDWLRNAGLWPDGAAKPVEPKRAVLAALKQTRKRRSSSLYYELATVVGLNRCSDLRFAKFKTTLASWFAANR